MHNCYKCSGPESEYGLLRMMETAVVKSWEVQRCWGTSAEVVVPVPGKSVPGTGTPKLKINSGQVVPVPLSSVLVPPSKNSPEAKWYQYHTYWYRYRHVIFAGIEQNSDSNARVHPSFDHQFEITMENDIKAKEKVERADFGA